MSTDRVPSTRRVRPDQCRGGTRELHLYFLSCLVDVSFFVVQDFHPCKGRYTARSKALLVGPSVSFRLCFLSTPHSLRTTDVELGPDCLVIRKVLLHHPGDAEDLSESVSVRTRFPGDEGRYPSG